ncbi:hypothetical protein ElyMa_006010900 [Elysia marginata]|uniref:LITAF domain-containing protein n=1 Tax=Elysia marginata TaxID=1093978 RepID=A0AAV4GIA3_9GAST|nr:hypothetical protein ElyMa_006010900 [Elysia marginata]
METSTPSKGINVSDRSIGLRPQPLLLSYANTTPDTLPRLDPASISSTADLVQCLHVHPARKTTEPVQNKGRYWLVQCPCNLCGQLQFYLGH